MDKEKEVKKKTPTASGKAFLYSERAEKPVIRFLKCDPKASAFGSLYICKKLTCTRFPLWGKWRRSRR